MVSTRAQYLIHILDKIGRPLLAGVNTVKKDADAASTAESVATLLAKTVQLSIDIGRTANLNDGTEDDSLRVALATLAGPIIAERYAQDKEVPSEDVINRIVAGLESALTFSENFKPSIKTAGIVNAADDDALSANGPELHYLKSVLPVIDAVTISAFGQDEKKLVADIGARLSKESERLRDSLFGGDLDDNTKKTANLVVMRAVAALYASCHKQEVGKDLGSIYTVWSSFDKQSALLETLVKSIVDPESVDTAPDTSDSTAPAPEETSAAAPSPLAQVVDKKPSVPPMPAPAKEKPKAGPTSGGASPMGFFAKKDSSDNDDNDEDEPENISDAEPEEEATPKPAPKEEAPKTENKSSSGSSGGGNPMSFFKTPPKDDD